MASAALGRLKRLCAPKTRSIAPGKSPLAAVASASARTARMGSSSCSQIWLSKAQAEYLGVDVAGPYKPEHYRY